MHLLQPLLLLATTTFALPAERPQDAPITSIPTNPLSNLFITQEFSNLPATTTPAQLSICVPLSPGWQTIDFPLGAVGVEGLYVVYLYEGGDCSEKLPGWYNETELWYGEGTKGVTGVRIEEALDF